MIGTVNDFFGGNLEETVMEDVVVWEGEALTGGGVQLSQPMTDFEELVFYSGFKIGGAGEIFPLAPTGLLGEFITGTSPTNTNIGSRYSGTSSYVSINVMRNSATWVACSFDNSTNWVGVLTKIVGRKRRLARLGIDEIMSSMGMPNLVANCDLTDNPINQRRFDGNWANLGIGAYGYDQWIKVSNSHMGYVIEAGKYRPNTKHTMTINDVVIKEFMSPASGHFVVAVPFANTGKFDIYAGRFKRPWHPQESGLTLCRRYFVAESGNVRAWAAADLYGVTFKRYAMAEFRISPVITKKAAGSVSPGSSVSLEKTSDDSEIFLRLTNSTGVGTWSSVDRALFHIDATILWEDLSSNVIIAL